MSSTEMNGRRDRYERSYYDGGGVSKYGISRSVSYHRRRVIESMQVSTEALTERQHGNLCVGTIDMTRGIKAIHQIQLAKEDDEGKWISTTNKTRGRYCYTNNALWSNKNAEANIPEGIRTNPKKTRASTSLQSPRTLKRDAEFSAGKASSPQLFLGSTKHSMCLKKEDDLGQQYHMNLMMIGENDHSDVEFTEWLASKVFSYKTMDHYTMKALWIYWARGDDEVERTDEESSDSDGEDEVAKIFRIER
ncbi:hypothetical protein Tco_1498941 [Tanacetum coccineum]